MSTPTKKKKKPPVCRAVENIPYTLTELSELITAHKVLDHKRMCSFGILAIATYADCVRKLKELRTDANSEIIDDLIGKQHILFHGYDRDPDEEEV